MLNNSMDLNFKLYFLTESSIKSIRWEDIDHQAGQRLGGMGSEAIYRAPLVSNPGKTVVVKKNRNEEATVSEYLGTKLFNALSMEGVQAPEMILVDSGGQLHIVMEDFGQYPTMRNVLDQGDWKQVRQANKQIMDTASVAHAFLDSRDIKNAGNTIIDRDNKKVYQIDISGLAKTAHGADRWPDSPVGGGYGAGRRASDKGFGPKIRDLYHSIRYNKDNLGPQVNKDTGEIEHHGMHGNPNLPPAQRNESLITQIDHILTQQKAVDEIFKEVIAEIKERPSVKYVRDVQGVIYQRFEQLGLIKNLLQKMSLEDIANTTDLFS